MFYLNYHTKLNVKFKLNFKKIAHNNNITYISIKYAIGEVCMYIK